PIQIARLDGSPEPFPPGQYFQIKLLHQLLYGHLISHAFTPSSVHSTTVALIEKAIAFGSDETERWLDAVCANTTKPRHESTEQLVAKGLFPGGVALLEPSRASQSPAAFECSQALEGAPPLFFGDPTGFPVPA